MEELFNKPILDQMYDFIKEKFEQAMYDKNSKIKEVESKIGRLSEEFTNYLKTVIPNQDDYQKTCKMFSKYELEYSKEVDIWGLAYFKLGLLEREKIRNEFFKKETKINDKDTFLNYSKNNFSEWIEEQKIKYMLKTKEYKDLQKRYREIIKKYPIVAKVYEDLMPIELNKEEIMALVDLREIDIELVYMELNLCFKLGMKEVINF